MFDPLYIRQAKLLLRCLPEIKKHACFALKGGTAINLFFRPMPRLSVDIDLTYLPLSNREAALADIARTMEAIRQDVLKRIDGSRVQSSRGAASAGKLVVTLEDVHIKIEPNQVLRGSVYPPETRDLCAEAQSLFELFVSVQTLSLADVYGGKLCAALDRQHPRDLFDVRLLLANEGLTPQVRRAFVVYRNKGVAGAPSRAALHALSARHRLVRSAVIRLCRIPHPPGNAAYTSALSANIVSS